jgi:hypothetical protein
MEKGAMATLVRAIVFATLRPMATQTPDAIDRAFAELSNDAGKARRSHPTADDQSERLDWRGSDRASYSNNWISSRNVAGRIVDVLWTGL